MKKALSIVLCVAFIVSAMLTGCGKSQNAAQQTTSDQQQASTSAPAETTPAETASDNTVKLPIVSDGTTVTIACVDSWYPQAPYTPELPVFKELIKRTGINIKSEALPDDQYWKAMKVRVAAAANLPDLFTLPDDPMKLGNLGIIIPLEGLIDEHAPDIKTVMGEAPALAKYMKKGDGHIWAFPQYTPGNAITAPSAPVIIRKDWVEKLGMKLPTTQQELTDVLYAFKEKLKVSIPMTVEWDRIGGVLSYAPLFDLNLGWDYRASSSYFWSEDHKTLINQNTRPEMKEFIAWLAKLYKDGILDKEFAQSNTDVMVSKMTSGKSGVIPMGWAHNIAVYNQQSQDAGQTGAEWYALEPPTPANGKKPWIDIGNGFNGQFGISKDCKNPEVVVKLMDYWAFTKEGYTLKEFGIEGLSYTKDANGNIHFTDLVNNNPNKLSARQALWSIGAIPNLPVLVPSPTMKSVYVDPSAYIENNPVLMDASKRLSPFFIEGMPTLSSTEEENTELLSIVTDCDTFRVENLMKFIVGQKDMSEWDAFIEEWKKMGLSREEEIWQKMLDRYNQN
jgi:putative aldouronate transport system substrate-binding protein